MLGEQVGARDRQQTPRVANAAARMFVSRKTLTRHLAANVFISQVASASAKGSTRRRSSRIDGPRALDARRPQQCHCGSAPVLLHSRSRRRRGPCPDESSKVVVTCYSVTHAGPSTRTWSDGARRDDEARRLKRFRSTDGHPHGDAAGFVLRREGRRGRLPRCHVDRRGSRRHSPLHHRLPAHASSSPNWTSVSPRQARSLMELLRQFCDSLSTALALPV